MPKKVLIITYYWPPSGGSGVQRWAYFSRDLKRIGDIEPVVLTVDPKYASYPLLDYSLETLTKDVRTVRTKSFDLLRAYSVMKGGKSRGHIPQGSVGKSSKKSLFDRISLYVRANFFIPDARIGWNKYALKAAQEIIKKEKIDTIITTGPPHSTHLIALALKKKHKLKWITDFRDPWREVYYNELFKRSPRKDRYDAQLEQKVIGQCDHLLTVGHSMGQLFKNKLKNESNKVHVFHNGYDAELLQKCVGEQRDRFTMTHIGVLSQKQPFLAIAKCIEKLAVKYNIRFETAGNVCEAALDRFNSIKGIEYVHHGKVEHEKAISLMKSASLLINCLAETDHARLLISGKLMEYIACERPILVIGDKKGDAAKLVDRFNSGIVAQKHEIELMVGFVKKLIEDPGSFQPETKEIEEFSRYSISKKLSTFIKTLKTTDNV